MWRRSKNLNDRLIQSDEDTEPKRPLVVSHFPYGLLALATLHGIAHWPVARVHGQSHLKAIHSILRR